MQLLTKAVYIALLALSLATAAASATEPGVAELQAEPQVEQAAEPVPKTGAETQPDPAKTPETDNEPETANERVPVTVPKPEPRQSLAFQRQEPASERSSNSGLSLGKIAISLAAVLLLVVVLGWIFKKLTLRLPGSQHVKVICSVPIGQRERLLVIEIQGKQRVLGVTPQSINMLFELENSLPETKLASDFHTQLQSFLKK